MKSRSVGCAGPFLVVVLWATPTLADQEQPAPQETTVVEGQVFDHIGAGVKDAEIAVTRPADGSDQPEPLAKTTTNATGDFRLVIEGKISGKLLVSISKKGYSAASREIEIDPEDEFPAFVDVELAGAAILFGVVRDARTDKPIAGASIRVGATFRDWSGESGPEGEFRIPDLPPGEVTVTVDADGYGREKFEVKSVEQLGHLIVTLKPERIVHLQTEDAQGQPVGGVIVECIDENRRDFRSLATDAEGTGYRRRRQAHYPRTALRHAVPGPAPDPRSIRLFAGLRSRDRAARRVRGIHPQADPGAGRHIDRDDHRSIHAAAAQRRPRDRR
ncbi:MAG: carboxypeptidase regulatory-like domain-containing protein [Planctomycetota bacterium]|jgi:hypothetical protein